MYKSQAWHTAQHRLGYGRANPKRERRSLEPQQSNCMCTLDIVQHLSVRQGACFGIKASSIGFQAQQDLSDVSRQSDVYVLLLNDKPRKVVTWLQAQELSTFKACTV